MEAIETKINNAAIFKTAKTFSSFSVNDLKAAKEFYGRTLGLDVSEQTEGLAIKLAGGADVFIYPKEKHEAASFTILNFLVDDIDAAVEALNGLGVQFESYEGETQTDENNIFRGAESGRGPNIAWFKDPAGNFLSVIEEN